MSPKVATLLAVCCALLSFIPTVTCQANATRPANDYPPIVLGPNAHGMQAVILPLGAIVQRLIVPDKNGNPVDVALGMTTAQEYLDLRPNPYLGAVIGRVANRIVGSNFTLDGMTYRTTVNDMLPVPGANTTTPTVNDTIHGGVQGFTFKIWDARKVQMLDGDAAVLHLSSPDGDQGFPGEVDTWVIYKLLNATNRVEITFLATTDAPTPINLNTHAYFNLNGGGSNTTIENHMVQINSDYYTPVFPNAIVPTGQIAPVNGTLFDLRQPTVIGNVIDRVPSPDVPTGYDINFITPLGYPNYPNITEPAPRPVKIVTISSPTTGIQLTAYTNAPGFQWYTGNHLPGPNETQIHGINGAPFIRRGGFAIESQWWPMSLAHPQFPSIIVRPGQIYEQQLIWDFSIAP